MNHLSIGCLTRSRYMLHIPPLLFILTLLPTRFTLRTFQLTTGHMTRLSPLDSPLCPTSTTLSTPTRCHIAPKQRYTYALTGQSWPINIQSHAQLPVFVCSYVETQSKPMDAREQNRRQLFQAPNQTFSNAVQENPRPADIPRDFRQAVPLELRVVNTAELCH